ncbi:MAG TPA: non-homologous end-joining DNA ligase [bacterium]|nr:non-homologous end-joining DNA ligase [bacterium]
MAGHSLQIEGHELKLSNLDKVFYPAADFTKAQVLDYYIRIAPHLLPHLKGRPLTLKRYPEGVRGPFFYEKRCPPYRPSWFKTTRVFSEHRGEDIHYCMVEDLAQLVWLVNLADLELHVSLSLGKDILRPTTMVFDLDPGPGVGILECADLALRIKEFLGRQKLECLPKTSGSKGIQVYVPLNTPVDYERTKTFAKGLAEAFEARYPQEVVSKMAKSLRKGKIFIDWSQNDDHKTTVCVYSLRAKERPTVSTPLRWTELSRALKSGDAEALSFDADAVLKRAKKYGDLFAPVLKLKQKLEELCTPSGKDRSASASSRSRSRSTRRPGAKS